jgi:glyoxylase-like metal-dependent hydrolase (beta-lactamase superfamily II)
LYWKICNSTNISVGIVYGHTPGQIAVLFDTEEGNYAFPGDVVPTSLNLSLSWLSAYDNSVVIAMKKKNVLRTKQ